MTSEDLVNALGVLENSRLSPQQFLVLYMAHNLRPSMSAIAACTGHSTAAVTGIVDRMLTDDLVARKPDEEDRRVIRVETTKSGESLLKIISDNLTTL